MIESTKNPIDKINTPEKLEEDFLTEKSLRPSMFDDFVGQQETIQNLKVYIQAAKQRG